MERRAFTSLGLGSLRLSYALRVTLCERRHCVQTRAVRCTPRSSIRTDWRLGSQRRLVLFIAWLTLLPALGPLPQISQRFAITGRWYHVVHPEGKRKMLTAGKDSRDSERRPAVDVLPSAGRGAVR
jgi:hypothetical protein